MLKGIIVNNISNIFEVKIENKVYTCTARKKIKQNDLSPVVGDYVEIEEVDDKNNGVICNIMPRSMYSKRPKMANLTQMIFVVSLDFPKPDLLLLDKQLVYANINNINAVICINKIDLGKKEELEEICNIYEKIGYKVIKTNAKEKYGIEELRDILKNNITAFSGNSGVGKSTLINAIFEKNIADEGNISIKNSRGKNTTTAIKLYEILDNAYIADTPGFSTFDLEHEEVSSNDLDMYFNEFKLYLNDCKYQGCNHIKETDCKIKEALNNNLINKNRYDNYCKIYNKLKEKEDYRWK